jgi:hypothetical protein
VAWCHQTNLNDRPAIVLNRVWIIRFPKIGNPQGGSESGRSS